MPLKTLVRFFDDLAEEAPQRDQLLTFGDQENAADRELGAGLEHASVRCAPSSWKPFLLPRSRTAQPALLGTRTRCSREICGIVTCATSQ
jgi:hypothetical protein